jgi:cell division protein FtsB
MRNLKQKGIWGNIIRSKPVLILLGILILFFAWSIFGFWNKMVETGKNREIAENKLLLLKEQKEKLSANIDSLNTAEGKEKFFRENFGLAKEGEGMVVIIEDQNLPQPKENEDVSSFFSFIKNWFK